MEYICIMDFHTFQCLVFLCCIMNDVLDAEVAGLDKKTCGIMQNAKECGKCNEQSFKGVAVKEFALPTSFRKYCNHVIKILKQQIAKAERHCEIAGVLFYLQEVS